MGEIVLNGAARTIVPGGTIGHLLRELDVDPRWVVCELNGEPLGRDVYEAVRLAEGDRLELVRPVAGG
jgi:thiamine biosynthesis protein ThiS